MGDCDICSVETLSFYIEKYHSIEIVSWKCIGYEVVGITNEGKEKKAPKMHWKNSATVDFIKYLKPKLQYFVFHNYITSWQQS
jgi:hypothetical protein